MLPINTIFMSPITQDYVKQEKIEYVDKEGKKHTETTTTVNPSKSGAVAGAAAGAALGSVVPVVGTTAGAIAGGLIGLIFGPED